MTLPGSAAPLWFASWLRMVVDLLLVGHATAAPPVAYDGVAGKTTETYPDDLFALYVGPQWLQAWGSAQACVIVPSYGEPAQPIAFRTVGNRSVLGALGIGVDIHVWGDELLPAEPSSMSSIYHDIERYEASGIILQNVMRAVLIACRGAGLNYGTVDGWQNDTEILRHGEMFLARLAISFPIYDFAETAIEFPQTLTPGVAIKQPGE